MMNSEYTYVNRNISLYGMIDEESARHVVSTIKAINDYDDIVEQGKLEVLGQFIEVGVLNKDAVQGLEPRDPIVLEINSGGGYASAGFSIISAIESSQTPVIGHVTGDCMSMAIAVFGACHYRLSSRFAGFMMHDIRSGSEGKFSEMVSTIEYMKQVRENYKMVVLEYTNLEPEKVDAIVDANADYYFTPTKAKEMGLVDAIDSDEVDEALIMKKLYGVDIEVPELDLDSEELSELREDLVKAIEEISDEDDIPDIDEVIDEEISDEEVSLGPKNMEVHY